MLLLLMIMELYCYCYSGVKAQDLSLCHRDFTKHIWTVPESLSPRPSFTVNSKLRIYTIVTIVDRCGRRSEDRNAGTLF